MNCLCTNKNYNKFKSLAAIAILRMGRPEVDVSDFQPCELGALSARVVLGYRKYLHSRGTALSVW